MSPDRLAVTGDSSSISARENDVDDERNDRAADSPSQGSESVRDSASESDAESFVLPDALATGREKRQTAGNKLREMLEAELEAEELFAEDPDDDDFGSDQDKQNDHDSELDGSSDEEKAYAEVDDSGERALRIQEKQARSRKRKANAAFANAGQSVGQAPVRVVEIKKAAAKKRRLEKLAEGNSTPQSASRQSTRSHAVKVAHKTEKRLKEEAERKAKASPTVKVQEHIMTQEERLERAKEIEVVNLQSLNRLERYEEERKAAQEALSKRRKYKGPVLRYVSRARRTSTGATDAQDPVYLLSFENVVDTMQNITLKEHIFNNQDLVKSEYPTKSICNITGQPAPYRDPESGIPYATADAYKILQRLKAGQFPWNPVLSMYIYNPFGELSDQKISEPASIAQ